jgi:hypothetical protein
MVMVHRIAHNKTEEKNNIMILQHFCDLLQTETPLAMPIFCRISNTIFHFTFFLNEERQKTTERF